MPRLDKPLDELLRYPGRNPRPVDFDAYWDASLQELAATDPKPELVPNPAINAAHSETFDLWFTGVGGARLYAKYLRPKNYAVGGAANRKSPALLQFHGYSMNSGDWFSKLAYSREGFCVAALDSRSQGGRSRNQGSVQGTTWKGHIMRGLDDPDPRKLFFRQLFLDTAQLARVVMHFDEVDAKRVGAMGASQGGALVLACAALEPRIKRCVALYPFLCDFYTSLSTGSAFSELNHFLRLFDPLNERVEALFTRLGYIDCLHLAPRIKAQVLMYVGLTDTLCPPHRPICRVQPNHCTKRSHRLPQLRPRRFPRRARQNISLHAGAMNCDHLGPFYSPSPPREFGLAARRTLCLLRRPR